MSISQETAMPHILRERTASAQRLNPLSHIDLIDRLVPIRCLAVAVSSAAEARPDRRMMNAFTELGCRIDDDLTKLIDELMVAAP